MEGMGKRVGDASTEAPPGKKFKLRPRLEARADAVPQWLRDAADVFVVDVPRLSWTGGFYSWGTWLERLCTRELWDEGDVDTAAVDHNPSAGSHPDTGLDDSAASAEDSSAMPTGMGPWRVLIETCKRSGQVRGPAAMYRAKGDLVSTMINAVYRLGETKRVSGSGQEYAAERDIMRRVRAVVTRQRRHEGAALTLIRFLDFAFIWSAYVDCRMDSCVKGDPESRKAMVRILKDQLAFMKEKPGAKVLAAVAAEKELFMRENRWLPWYEEVPGVRNEMVIRAREAATAFCVGLPFPRVDAGTGVRGLSRDHLAGAGSMDEWLLTLLNPALNTRWAGLAETYNIALRDGQGEENALLEETARRVVEKVLEPITEDHEDLDAVQSKIVDAAPGIVVTQAVRSDGRFTFRQLLELFITMSSFAQYVRQTYYNRDLPSLKEIHSGVAMFEEITERVADVRSVIDLTKLEQLMEWCLSAGDHQQSLDGVRFYSCGTDPGCKRYQRRAIGSALGHVVIRFATVPFPRSFLGRSSDPADSDPLSYAAVVAEWDPALAAKIIDASVRIGQAARTKFANDMGDGLDLYTYRRMVVCDAARERCAGDLSAAGEIMAKLHPVWDSCEQDKLLGTFDERGAMALWTAVERGNFEAASFYGLLLCSEAWAERRQAANVMRDVSSGIRYLSRALEMGDAAAAVDLVNLLIPSSSERMPPLMIDLAFNTLKDAAQRAPAVSLVVGYLYSLGAPGIPADCVAAARAYERVLETGETSTRCRAFAANNLAVLLTVGDTAVMKDGAKAREYFTMAAMAGDAKAKSNLAAALSHGALGTGIDVAAARQMYREFFAETDCDTPITVVQKNDRDRTLLVYELQVHKGKQEPFCAALAPTGMDLQLYGTIVRHETVPAVP